MKSYLFLLTALAWVHLVMAQGTMLLTQPTLSEEYVVFVYANDLWRTSINGGESVRLTTNEGYEFAPHISPDGKHIAFSGQYGGNTDVYVIPIEGGEPQRVTWHPGSDVVQGWTPDKKVLFQSGRAARPTVTNQLYTIALSGGLPEAVPVQRAAYGTMSADGKYLAYVPISSWDPEWRNYRGGQAMPIWIVDLNTKELIRTPQSDLERHTNPIWYKNKVYYLSERDYAANVWSFDPLSKTEEQITFFKKFDAKSIGSSSNGLIVEQGGLLHRLQPETKVLTTLEINVRGDMNWAQERWESVNANNINHAALSPTGKRALIEYRGEILSVPKENGTWRNLTNSTGSAERYPVWSPKGDQVAWFSDESGEYALVIADQMGKKLKTISLPNASFFFKPEWSPDGLRIAFTDTHYNIWVVNVKTAEAKVMDTDRYAHPNRSMNPIWSPDSKWIAYAKQLDSHYKSIFIKNVVTQQSIQVTDGMADAISPIWDEKGKYLYFLASTNYGLQSGWLDMSSYDPKVTRQIYAAILSNGTASPHLPTSDEEKVDSSNVAKDAIKDNKDSLDLKIDADGIFQRIIALDMPAKNYVSLEAAPANFVFVLEQLDGSSSRTVHKYDVEKAEAKKFSSDISGMTVSHDRSSALLYAQGSWSIVDTKSPPSNGDGKLKMDAKILVNPRAEYRQIFKEGWRYMRDFLYVDNVHGAPWDKVYEWYSPWIDHVRHRTDLNYVVDIMSGEVAIGHSYVSGGDIPRTESVPIGLLGCDFEIDGGKLKIQKIYTGESWNPSLKAPLGQPGSNIKERDYIIAVNGRKYNQGENPYSLFEQTSGRETLLTISTDGINNRDVWVVPVSNENGLRAVDWVESNRKTVNELSNGQLAYVYVPNTSGGGFESFNRYYFSQQDKKGVIIDERNNGGGSAADYMIDIMSRTVMGYFNSRANDKRPWTTPMAGIWGPKVMIINERAGSGGDLLPFMFREKNLGPLVGTKTWGGLVGTWDTPRFIDGGRMVAPRGGFFDKYGEWAVEGEGVAPDIEVIQEPKMVAQGRDPQLERAVQEALELLKTQRFELKPEPKAPIRSKRPIGFKWNE